VLASLATVLLLAALAGAAVSWTVGAVAFARALPADGATRVGWLAIVAWPFGLKRLQGAAAEHAARTNKALVAFFACLIVAAAATSVATNLHRISK
jgi:hypothetical protein